MQRPQFWSFLFLAKCFALLTSALVCQLLIVLLLLLLLLIGTRLPGPHGRSRTLSAAKWSPLGREAQATSPPPSPALPPRLQGPKSILPDKMMAFLQSPSKPTERWQAEAEFDAAEELLFCGHYCRTKLLCSWTKNAQGLYSFKSLNT